MTETEWNASLNPLAMFDRLTGTHRRGLEATTRVPDNPQQRSISQRKLRLFTCACTRAAGHLSPPHHEEEAERLADGGQIVVPYRPLVNVYGRWPGAEWCLTPDPWEGANAWVTAGRLGNDDNCVLSGGQRADLLRDLFCPHAVLPLLYEPTLDPEFGWVKDVTPLGSRWLDWQDRTVERMAWEAYRSRDFRHTPMIADALEDAGCTHARLLQHLRHGESHHAHCWVCQYHQIGDACAHCVKGVWATTPRGKPMFCDACRATGIIQPPPPHVRGCWAIDVLTGLGGGY